MPKMTSCPASANDSSWLWILWLWTWRDAILLTFLFLWTGLILVALRAVRQCQAQLGDMTAQVHFLTETQRLANTPVIVSEPAVFF